MASITEAMENLFEEKKIPVRKNVLENDQISYNGRFNLGREEGATEDKIIDFGITVREFTPGSGQSDATPTTDFLIHYRQLSYLTDFNKREACLDVFNDIHAHRLAGYYTMCLNGDGEIFINTFGRTGEDLQAFYETLVLGSQIAKNIMPLFDKKLEAKLAKK